MATRLYIEDMFSADGRVPGRVILYVPCYNPLAEDGNVTYQRVYGILTSEVSIGGSNKWGPIFSGLDALRDFTSLMGEQELVAWIGATVQCWKGTDPIAFTVDFTMVNYKPGLKLEEQIKNLMKLASITKTGQGFAKVAVHGGYGADALQSNNYYFSSKGITSLSDFNIQAGDVANIGAGYQKGTVTIEIGSRFKIRNLLVSKCVFTPSTVEVVDSNSESEALPLYYNVSVTLMGTHALLSTDVDAMFDSPVWSGTTL